ncbi:cytochrome c oxidase subunit 6A1, mitochondrial-like [Styela clava]|uniref:cytochrome c oxidase subunit 6A1, mitochondrial-like n=1 Tax=Styela clava TaxID=7725 RepID=UPI00193A668C|nr:cytochrome c oxidase subunit 6A1, mitochondrial-like [Styela clava]XP_039267219.1 cytochrome c oxidase subunit 6A1, mitochondrial-like [Styela clava]
MASLVWRRLPQYAPQMCRFAHAPSQQSTAMFKWMTYLGIPAVVGTTAIFVYKREQQHHAHYHRPEYKSYAHMGLRSKKFPWGDGNHSLFHNPKTNAIPGEGYEEDH